MNDQPCVEKEGRVIGINHGRAIIQLNQVEACDTCRMNGACHMDDAERKSLYELPAQNLHIGDLVSLEINYGSGLQAILWAYIIPFILMICTLTASLFLLENEGLSGALALGILVPYYFIFRQCKMDNHYPVKVNKR